MPAGHLNRRLLGSASSYGWIVYAGFDGANQALVNNDTLGYVGAGTTYEGDYTRYATTVKATQTGTTSNDILSGVWRWEGNAIYTLGSMRKNGTYNYPAVSGGTCKAKCWWEKLGSTVDYNLHYIYFFGLSGSEYYGFRWATHPINLGSKGEGINHIWTTPGTANVQVMYITSPFDELYDANGISPRASTGVQMAVVMGGFDANGKFDPNGTYGVHSFFKGNDAPTQYPNWFYGGCIPVIGAAGSPSFYPQFTMTDNFNNAGNRGWLEGDDFKMPDPRYINCREVFSATGYSADTFSTTFGTMTSGQSWTQQSGTWSTSGGAASCNGAGIATFDGNDAGLYIYNKVNTGTGSPSVVIGWLDANNYGYVKVDNSANSFQIRDVNAGVDTLRASYSVTIADNTDYHVYIQCYNSTYTQAWIADDAAAINTDASMLTGECGDKTQIMGLKTDGSTPSFKSLYSQRVNGTLTIFNSALDKF